MMWIVWIPIFVLFVALVVRLTGNNAILGYPGKREAPESPMDILERRYANGEITAEAFDEAKRTLESKSK